MQSKAQESVSLLYSSALKKIFKWNMFRKFGPGEKANIEQMEHLSNYFGNPQNKFKTIHVAGTNGKGTVSLKTARVLQSAGFKTGLFISPHISSFRERVTVNAELISMEETVKHAQHVFDAIEQKNLSVTFFEVVTMIAFLQFAEKNVDYAVLECGMGGRLDATNVVASPQCCAIASIGFDHVEILGSTLEQIAFEKAGIIKAGVPCVIGPTVVQDAVFMKAREMESKLIQVTKKNFRKANVEMVEKILEQIGVDIPQEAKEIGLKAEQPCRLERVPEDQLQKLFQLSKAPTVYMDVCHNPQAVECVIKELTKRHPMNKIIIACGFSKSKDMTSMLHFLATNPHVKAIYPVTTNHCRLSSISVIQEKIDAVAKLLHQYDHQGNPFQKPIDGGKIPSTLSKITQEASVENDILLICGSFFIMQDVREFYLYDDEFDPKDINVQ